MNENSAKCAMQYQLWKYFNAILLGVLHQFAKNPSSKRSPAVFIFHHIWNRKDVSNKLLFVENVAILSIQKLKDEHK